MDKKYKRRMGDPPHKIQKSDQSMTKTHPLYKETYTKKLVHYRHQFQVKLLLLLFNPFELQTKY